MPANLCRILVHPRARCRVGSQRNSKTFAFRAACGPSPAVQYHLRVRLFHFFCPLAYLSRTVSALRIKPPVSGLVRVRSRASSTGTLVLLLLRFLLLKGWCVRYARNRAIHRALQRIARFRAQCTHHPYTVSVAALATASRLAIDIRPRLAIHHRLTPHYRRPLYTPRLAWLLSCTFSLVRDRGLKNYFELTSLDLPPGSIVLPTHTCFSVVQTHVIALWA